MQGENILDNVRKGDPASSVVPLEGARIRTPVDAVRRKTSSAANGTTHGRVRVEIIRAGTPKDLMVSARELREVLESIGAEHTGTGS